MDTVDALNDLIETRKDGESGYRHAHEHAPTPELKQLFLAQADACRAAVAELHQAVAALGGTPQDSGSLREVAYLGWASLRETVMGVSALALLEDAERAEDLALEHYRSVLGSAALRPEHRALVERQFEAVKRCHAQMRALREAARQGAG